MQIRGIMGTESSSQIMDNVKISKALVEFQFKCPAIDKDSEVSVRTKTGGTYKFTYATFGNIIRTIKGAMHEAKLGYYFRTTDTHFVCRIVHESGEFYDTQIKLPQFKESMQENGSLLTYLKRYSLVLALGLDTDLDDDANTSEGNEPTFKYEPKETPKQALASVKAKTPKDYIVKVGKFKDKKLGDIDQLALQDYLTWLHKNAKDKNQNLTGDWLEFAKIAEQYITPIDRNEELI